MNHLLVKLKAIATILLFALFPSVLFAQTGGQNCSSTGYTIATVNGVFTGEDEAVANRDEMKRHLRANTYNNEPLTIDYLLNPSHIGGIGDAIKVIQQKYFEKETVRDYDLVEMLNDASQKVKTQKLLLVAHSQGNFYANSFHDVVAGQVGGLPAQAIGVYGVANPASRVAGNGMWLTSDTDHVISGLVKNIMFLRKIMSPNTHIEEVAGGVNPMSGHSFSEVYLKYRSTEIVAGVKASLDKLSADIERRTDILCIDPPKLTIAHKVAGVALAVADPVATVGVKTVATTVKAGVFIAVTTAKAGVIATVWAYHAGVATAVWTYNTTVATAIWTYNTGIATAKFVGNATTAVASAVYSGVKSLFSDTGTLAVNNTASVILATQAQGASSLPTTLPVGVVNGDKAMAAPATIVNQSAVIESSMATETTPVTAPVVLAILSTPAVPVSALTGSFSGFGGGAPPAVVAQTTTEEKDNETTVPTQETTALATPTYQSGVFPLIMASTTLSSAVATFSGTYNNGASFDKISFELKNISLDTATSSVLRGVATTTGEGLPYSEDLTLPSEGNWQYHARLEDSINASSTPWSAFLFFSLATSTVATTTIATSTEPTPVSYSVIAGQADHSTLDTTTSFVQGYGLQRNVILSQPTTFTGINKGDQGRIVAWYYFGYGQDCRTIGKVGLTAGPGANTFFVPISETPNWDGSCVFRLANANGSVTKPAGTYALYMADSFTHAPPYAYGKAGNNSNAVFCKGNEISANYCKDFSGYSANLSDFAYIVTSDTYEPPPIPEGVNSVPETASPIVARQSDRSTLDATDPSGYIIQRNVVLSQSIDFTGINNGDKGRIVAWYSFGSGQDCSTLGTLSLSTGPADSTFFSPVSATPGVDGSCVFRLAKANGSVTRTAGVYALYLANSFYSAGHPKPFGKAGGNANAVFCKGNEVYPNSCKDFSGYSANLSDFAYLITADTYATPLPPESAIVATTTPQTLSSARAITEFSLFVGTTTIAGIVDEAGHTVGLTVPFGTDIRALAPSVIVSPMATSSPASLATQDFTSSVVYTVTAEDGSMQIYTVTVTVAPDTTPPAIIGYTFNGTVADIIADFATTTPTITIVLAANENVDWVSIKIEDQNDSSNYKTFFSGVGCVDGTTECTKSWTGTLSHGAEFAPNSIYHIKVHIKDAAGNPYQGYLSPYVITVNTVSL